MIEATRRRFLAYFSSAGLSSTLLPGTLWAKLQESEEPRVTKEMIQSAAHLAGVDFTDEELELMLEGVNQNLERYEEIRETRLENSIAPPLYFDPRVPGMSVDLSPRRFRSGPPPDLRRPANLEEAAFWPLTHLARLVATRQVGSVELTEMYLSRLKRFNPILNCVVTLTEERARMEAARADAEIAADRYRGCLHGIPWGAKDIISARGYPTTWGAAPFRDQRFDADATVVERLGEAGAVLVAKLTTGELAFGDNWFGGRTNSPWNPEEGSSGSSAGSGAATAAGLVGFAVGTDTGGSILSPAVRCGVSGLRPTFGRVSRHGVMAAGYSLDKIGPMCRTAEGCAVVLDAIVGPDGKDLAVADVPFHYDATQDPTRLRLGYVASAFEAAHPRESEEALLRAREALETLRALGFSLTPVELPQNDLTYFIEYVERAAGFEEFARSRRDEGLRRTNHRGELRYSRMVPAVEYLQANRIRRLLMEETAAVMTDVNVVVSPWRAINPLTSMTGHPVVAVPSGFTADGTPTGVALVGQIYREGELLEVAKAYQDATRFHLRRPSLRV